MIGERLGPYVVERLLGSGSMGRVYLGRSEDGCVALKVLKPEYQDDPDYLRRFAREARAGSRVRHPNVVRTYSGTSQAVSGETRIYLQMEYVEGRTLRRLLEQDGPVSEPLLLEIARQAAEGLDAVHAAGLVHRDIKPENLLITEDDTVKLMDLGLARADADARLTQVGLFVGTPLYAAPEQLRGTEALDGRADLFSLGIVLYELASGLHPWREEGMRELLLRGTLPPPTPLRAATPALSFFVGEVVHDLLRPETEARIPSARDLLGVLREREASDWWQRRASPARAPSPRRPRLSRDTALHGRRREIERLVRDFERVRAEEGRVVLIRGEEGVGKTRLVDEFVAALRADGVDVAFLFGSYPPGGAATALRGFRQAFGEHLTGAGLESAVRRHLASAPCLVEPFLGLLRGEPPAPGREPLTRDSVQTAFALLLRALAAEKPAVVLVDDLHHAPPEGLALFASLALAVTGLRVLLFGTTRRGLDERWQAELTRLEHVHERRLGPLEPDAVEDLVAETLGGGLRTRGLGRLVADRSGGNPLFAFEILQELRERGALVPEEGRGWRATRSVREVMVPATVTHLFEARLTELEEADRTLLEIAACSGHEFDPQVVGEVAGEGRIRVLQSFGRIDRIHGLVRANGPGFVFEHNLVRQALRERLNPGLRELYHARIAECLERRLVSRPEDGALAAEICVHHVASRQPERACPYLERGLDHLEREYANEKAIELASRALEEGCRRDGPGRVDLLLRLAGICELTARPDRMREVLTEALAEADGIGDPAVRARVGHRLGAFLCAQGELEAGREVLREALALAREGGAHEEEAAVRARLGGCLAELGNPDAAEAEYRASLQGARSLGDRGLEAMAIGGLGQLCWERGDLARTREHMETCIASFREIGDRRSEARAIGMLGLVADSEGRYEDAAAMHREHFRIARAIGWRRGEAIAASNLGEALQALGQMEEARRRFERNRRISTEIGDREGIATADINVGILHWDRGRVEEAGEAFERSLHESRSMGSRRLEAHGTYWLGRNEERRGRLDRALELLETSVRMSRELDHRESLAEFLLAVGRLRLRRGEDAEAAPVLEEAVREAASEGFVPEAVLGTIHLARIRPDRLQRARRLLAEHEDRLKREARLEARYALWLVTGDDGDLRTARAELEGIEAPLDEDERRVLRERVELYRNVAEGRRPETTVRSGFDAVGVEGKSAS